MKRRMVSFINIILFLFLQGFNPISSHGFGSDTYVRLPRHGGSHILEQMHDGIGQNHLVASYDEDNERYVDGRAIRTAEGETNCYFQISFGKNQSIKCTPTQEFYLPQKKEWVTAANLKSGDFLLGERNKLVPVEAVEFVKQRLEIYALEIDPAHTYFVGSPAVLTHNMPLPALTVGVSWAFGEGAAAGAAAGSYFGPVTLAGGLVVGGLIGVGAYYAWGGSKHYELNFDADAFENLYHHQYQNNDGSNPGPNGPGGEDPSGDFNDPNDPDDSKDEPDGEPLFDPKGNFDKSVRHRFFKKFYRQRITGEWWTKDRANHGGSVWKIFTERAKGLEWVGDADKWGRIIQNKHKGPTGRFIPWDELIPS